MVLSVLVPVYNEERHLERLVRYLFASSCPVEREWIFIDDASTDGSATILNRLAAEFNFRFLRFETNRGKGAAVIEGIRVATGDLILIQDADFEYDVNDVPALLKPLLVDQCDVVFGSRFKAGAPSNFHTFVNYFLTSASNVLSGLRLTDMETCYKIFRADLLKSMNLTSQRFGVEVEMTAYIAKLKVRVVELPISYQPRTRAEGKKIGWKDGVAALGHLIRFNLLVNRTQAFRAPLAQPKESRTLPKASGH